MMTARSASLATTLLAGLALFAISSAQAQSLSGTPAAGGGDTVAPSSEPAPISPLSSPQNQPQAPDDDADKKPAPPAALPGASKVIDAAPAMQAAKDMDPNSALFDAVNRGDIEAAKDALNRGADLQANNALGQTPLDMAIDLDRNAITFLLLSMRSGGASTGAPAVAFAANQPAAKSGGKAHHGHRTGNDAMLADSGSAPQVRTVSARIDGGTPQPQAGFLGFDH